MLADKIAANRARHAAQAAAHEARRVARGLAPRGRLKIDLAGRHAGTFTVPATWRLWGSVTTPDGIAGALYREDGGIYWQTAEDFARTLHVEDVKASLDAIIGEGRKCRCRLCKEAGR